MTDNTDMAQKRKCISVKLNRVTKKFQLET